MEEWMTKDLKTLSVFTLVLLLIAVCNYAITAPRPIDIAYKGVAFTLSDGESGEPVALSIEGDYRYLYSGMKSFNGQLVIGTKTFDHRDIPLMINKEGMGRLEKGQGAYFIHVSDKMKTIVVEVFETDTSGGYSFNRDTGLMIAGPAANREEAVVIAKDLLLMP